MSFKVVEVVPGSPIFPLPISRRSPALGTVLFFSLVGRRDTGLGCGVKSCQMGFANVPSMNLIALYSQSELSTWSLSQWLTIGPAHCHPRCQWSPDSSLLTRCQYNHNQLLESFYLLIISWWLTSGALCYSCVMPWVVSGAHHTSV